MAQQLAPAEIKAFSHIMEELNYYEILEIQPGAERIVIRDAFHQAARRYHPDGYRNAEEATHKLIDQISKRITEAYTILRNPRRRKAYDELLAKDDDEVRIPLAEAEAAAEKSATEAHQGTTPNGRRYFSMANNSEKQGDIKGAVRNLQMALTYERDNALFKEKLEELRKQLPA
jgi:DnaJ-class molecular chaperone